MVRDQNESMRGVRNTRQPLLLLSSFPMSESKATLLAALKDLVDEDTAWTILIKPDPVPSLIVREPDSGFELHLGNQEHADSFGLLGERKIGAVVSVCADEEECAARTSMYAPAIRFHGFHIKDDEEFDLLGALDAIFLALDALRADGRPTILHCRAGMSRSPTIVAAYLMHAYDLHMLDAFRIVKGAFPVRRGAREEAVEEGDDLWAPESFSPSSLQRRGRACSRTRASSTSSWSSTCGARRRGHRARALARGCS